MSKNESYFPPRFFPPVFFNIVIKKKVSGHNFLANGTFSYYYCKSLIFYDVLTEMWIESGEIR